MSRWRPQPWLAAAAVALLSACSSDSSGAASGDAGDQAALITCQNDARVDAYSPGLSKTSTSGKWRFVLTASDPAPPARGTNTWTLSITDAAGAPQTGATVNVTPFMPDHGHGTSVVPTVTAQGNDYAIANLYLFMPGVWRVTIDATANGATDSAVFMFCVPG